MASSESGILKPVPSKVSLPLHHSDPFLYIERQSRQLQQELQTYLDVQSAGLAAGLPASTGDDSMSDGSLTPTPSQRSNRANPVTIPVRQPRQRKPGLRSARRGILRSMHRLLSLKEEERRIIGTELDGRKDALRDVDNFTSKRDGLQKTIGELQRDQSVATVEDLKVEAKSLENEMHDLEMKLMRMRERHRDTLNEISRLQNSVDSRMSSYKESLSLLDADVKRYLKSPPIKPLPVEGDTTPNFYSLNPQRRTLEMAKEHWTGEHAELRKRKRAVDLEIDALKEGGGVWNKAISAVSDFEKMLVEETHQSTILSPPSQAPGLVQKDIQDTRAAAILGQVDKTTAQLESLLQFAEQKNWNLLICCIGAELEAFRLAKPILLNILRPGENEDQHDSSSTNDDVPPEFLTDSNDVPPSPGGDSKYRRRPSKSTSASGSKSPPPFIRAQPDDEDNEPDPAWLLS